jgi:hypothetical protein
MCSAKFLEWDLENFCEHVHGNGQVYNLVPFAVEMWPDEISYA